MKINRKLYDRDFKINAVKVSYEKNSLKRYAEEIGILPCLLTRWRKEFQQFGTASFQGPGFVRVHPDQKRTFELEKRKKESELRFEILKQGAPFLLQGNLPAYQFIKDNEKKYGVVRMCEVLGIGSNRYLTWKYKGISEKKKYLILLRKEITSIFLDFKKLKGKNQITKELNNRGFTIDHRRVSFHMKALGLRRIKKKFKITTTDSKHSLYTPPNVLNRNFTVSEPGKFWVSDITYLHTTKGFLYLTIIMDLYDRKIIGWNISSELSTIKTTIPAWEMAVRNRKTEEGLVFHSDRGVQYASKAFAEKLESYNCIRSMSGKGNHFDNAVAEGFFSTLKRELIRGENRVMTPKQMRNQISEFIENWYNKKRIHTSLNFKTIEEFNTLNS